MSAASIRPLTQRRASVAFAGCHITPGARAQALDAMASGWLSTGQRTQTFEQALATWIGARHAVAVSSCTAAIELALRALDLEPGSAVLTPTITFCGAIHAIVHAGLRPVLVDTDEETLTVNAESLTDARRHNPAAMVVQHMAGYPVPVRIMAAAAGLPVTRVVEDAAHGLGAEDHGQPVGTLESSTCFSFYATKNLPIGEGGAITTADAARVDRLRVMRQHGMSKDAWRRYEPGSDWRYGIETEGLKANFTDLQAAIGLGQLPHLASWQSRRAELADRYDEQLAEVPGVMLPPRPPAGRHAWHLYVIRVGAAYGRSRDSLAAALAERGIGTSVHFIPAHHFGYFQRLLGSDIGDLPVADRLADELLSLPLHPYLTDEDLDQVCAQITDLGRRGRDL
jgi:dTDP-4-amino-4,6-dideoxygalactose transaminase